MKYILLSILLINSLVANAKSVTVFTAQGGDFNLLEFIPKVVSSDLKMDPSYFVGINYADQANIPILTKYLSDKGLKTEVELQLSKHHGMQDNYEAHSAILARSKNFNTIDFINTNFAFGIGISHAMGTPWYEDTESGSIDGKRYKTQNYLAFEMEMATQRSSWSIPIRLHHRSGMYGLIAPEKVGSNFIAVGIRRKF